MFFSLSLQATVTTTMPHSTIRELTATIGVVRLMEQTLTTGTVTVAGLTVTTTTVRTDLRCAVLKINIYK